MGRRGGVAGGAGGVGGVGGPEECVGLLATGMSDTRRLLAAVQLDVGAALSFEAEKPAEIVGRMRCAFMRPRVNSSAKSWLRSSIWKLKLSTVYEKMIRIVTGSRERRGRHWLRDRIGGRRCRGDRQRGQWRWRRRGLSPGGLGDHDNIAVARRPTGHKGLASARVFKAESGHRRQSRSDRMPAPPSAEARMATDRSANIMTCCSTGPKLFVCRSTQLLIWHTFMPVLVTMNWTWKPLICSQVLLEPVRSTPSTGRCWRPG